LAFARSVLRLQGRRGMPVSRPVCGCLFAFFVQEAGLVDMKLAGSARLPMGLNMCRPKTWQRDQEQRDQHYVPFHLSFSFAEFLKFRVAMDAWARLFSTAHDWQRANSTLQPRHAHHWSEG
jgi:hypothetical protein